MEDEPLSEEDVKQIATLPTLDEARGKIVGILATPAQKSIASYYHGEEANPLRRWSICRHRSVQ